MNSLSCVPYSIAAILLVGTLTGCATDRSQHHLRHHPDMAASHMRMGDMAGPGGMRMQQDMKAMCDMQEKMMGAKTVEERRALMAEHMKAMSPEMRKRNMAMMQEHMRTMQEHMQMMQEHMGGQAPAK